MSSEQNGELSKRDTVELRRKHIGPSCKLFFRQVRDGLLGSEPPVIIVWCKVGQCFNILLIGGWWMLSC